MSEESDNFIEQVLKAFIHINKEISSETLEHNFSPRFVDYFVKSVLHYQGNEYIFERQRTDITLQDENNLRVVVIETKKPKEDLDAEKWREQAGKYADESTKYVGLTNGYTFLLWQNEKGHRVLKVNINFKNIIDTKRAKEDKLTTQETEQILFLKNISKEELWNESKYNKFN